MTGGQVRPRKIVALPAVSKYYHSFNSWSTWSVVKTEFSFITGQKIRPNIFTGKHFLERFSFLKMRQDSITSHCHGSHKPNCIIFYLPALFQLLLSSSPNLYSVHHSSCVQLLLDEQICRCLIQTAFVIKH